MPRINVTFRLPDGGELHGHTMAADGSVGTRAPDPFAWRSWSIVMPHVVDTSSSAADNSGRCSATSA